MKDTYSQNVAQPLSKMNLDDDPLLFKEGEISFALNAVAGRSFYRNEKANRINAALPEGFFKIGEEPIDSNRIVLILTNPVTGVGQLGIFQYGLYTPVTSSVKYNFSITHQVQAKVKITYLGEIIVYMTDNYNPMRRVNLMNVPQINGDIDVDLLNVFQNYNIAEIRISEILDNGLLLSGTYYIIAQYADANGNALTAWFTPVGPVPIIKDLISDTTDHIDGIASNQGTNKAIRIQLFNVDLSYQFMNVGFIKLAEGVHRCFKVDTISTSHQEYVFNGSGNVPEEITLEEVTRPVVSYERAKTLEIVNKDILMWGNLKGKRKQNLQPYFNNLQVQWQVERQLSTDNATNFANPISSTYRRVFRFGENYIIGIVLIYKDGSKSQVYFVSGRKINHKADGTLINNISDVYGNAVTAGEWDTMPVGSNTNTEGVSPDTPRWKLYNTAIVSGTDMPDGSFQGPAEWGEMGYFESTERFPIDARIWGDNAGQPIRLHSMPDNSVIPLFQSETTLDVETAAFLNYLGIRFPNVDEVIASLPDDVKAQLQGWEIVVGDRSYNKSVVATGVLYNTLYNNWRGKYTGADDVRLYANYPFNDVRTDPFYIKYPGLPEGWDDDDHSESDYVPYLNNQLRRDIFTFVSPDTSFSKSFLNTTRLKVHGEMFGKSVGHYVYVSPYPRFDNNDSSTPDYVALHNYNVGWYNNYKLAEFIEAVRSLKDVMYIPFNSQVSTGNIGMPFQNLLGESTVVIGLRSTLSDTTVVDVSREILGGNPGGDNPLTYELYTPQNEIHRNISSYYVSLCRIIDNQYGNIYNMKWRTTNYNHYLVANNVIVFGGDTFIGLFTVKRQHVYFQNAQAYMNWNDGQKVIDLRYAPTDIMPRWYAMGDDNVNDHSNLQWPHGTAAGGHDGGHIGLLPLITTGVSVLYMESDDNLNFRMNGTQEWETFYNNMLNGSVDFLVWTGIKHIDKDNYYMVNDDFSALNDISFYENPNPSYDPDNNNALNYYGRVIYSLESAAEDIFDNWRVYLPLNYYDFPKNEGPIIDIRDIGNYRTLFRLTNGLFMDKLYSVIETTEDGLNLGSGKLFERKPEKLVTSDNLYTGTVSQWAFNNTPFGAVMVDMERGVVFQMGEQLGAISANKAVNWFFENLPYKLTRDIPLFGNVDNPANPEGIGCLSIYDDEFKRWILTKKDYYLLNPDLADQYSFDNGRVTFQGNPVSLLDATHFANCSFTISYSMLTGGWASFHSYLPDYYFAIGGLTYAGVNGQLQNNVYSYDAVDYHRYFGKSYPYILEGVVRNENLNIFSNIYYSFITKSFIEKARGRQGEQKFVTFNKAIVYNTIHCSGLLKLVIQDENDLSTLFTSLGSEVDARKLGLRRMGNEFNFSNVYDLTNSDYGQEGFFTSEWVNILSEYYIDKVLDNTLLDYTRDYREDAPFKEMYTKMRLILDNRNDVLIQTYLLGVSSQYKVQ